MFATDSVTRAQQTRLCRCNGEQVPGGCYGSRPYCLAADIYEYRWLNATIAYPLTRTV